MKVEILSDVMISGEPALAGSLIEVSTTDANLLIGMNKAKLPSDDAPKPEATASEADVKAPQLSEAEAPKRGRKPVPPTEA